VNADDVLSSSVLAPFLRTATLLTHLDLRSNAITHVGMEALGAALKANTSLQELHLSKNPLGDKGVAIYIYVGR
jgi:Ran GTPase-activating protein (RanGAP) involved in mRNA processing and transport